MMFDLVVASERSFIVYVRGEISLVARNQHVARLQTLLQAHQMVTLAGVLPAYDSLLVSFDPFRYSPYDIEHALQITLNEYNQTQVLPDEQNSSSSILRKDFTGGKRNRHRLPVWYGAGIDYDLPVIAENKNMEEKDVVALHCALIYRVFCLGFAPGFAFLGEVDERLSMPRRATPRASVPQGAVAIADRQTAIYPNESPGGWHIIGLCPLRLFNANSAPHVPMAVGDDVEFYEISQQEYHDMVETL